MKLDLSSSFSRSVREPSVIAFKIRLFRKLTVLG